MNASRDNGRRKKANLEKVRPEQASLGRRKPLKAFSIQFGFNIPSENQPSINVGMRIFGLFLTFFATQSLVFNMLKSYEIYYRVDNWGDTSFKDKYFFLVGILSALVVVPFASLFVGLGYSVVRYVTGGSGVLRN